MRYQRKRYIYSTAENHNWIFLEGPALVLRQLLFAFPRRATANHKTYNKIDIYRI